MHSLSEKFKPNIYISKDTLQKSLFCFTSNAWKGNALFFFNFWTNCCELYGHLLSMDFIICNWTHANSPNQRETRMTREGWEFQHLGFPSEQSSQRERWKRYSALRCWHFPVPTWTKTNFKSPKQLQPKVQLNK